MDNVRRLNQDDVEQCVFDYFRIRGKTMTRIVTSVTGGGPGDRGGTELHRISCEVTLEDDDPPRAEGAVARGLPESPPIAAAPATDPLRLHDFAERLAADGVCSICGRSLQAGNHYREPEPGWEPRPIDYSKVDVKHRADGSSVRAGGPLDDGEAPTIAADREPRPLRSGEHRLDYGGTAFVERVASQAAAELASEARPVPGERVGLMLDGDAYLELCLTAPGRFRVTVERAVRHDRERNSVWVGPAGVAIEVLAAFEELFLAIRRNTGGSAITSEPVRTISQAEAAWAGCPAVCPHCLHPVENADDHRVPPDDLNPPRWSCIAHAEQTGKAREGQVREAAERVRLLAIAQRQPWSCACGFQNPGVRRTCESCGWAPVRPRDVPGESADDETARRAAQDAEQFPMYYRRTCPSCGARWDSLHCPHDGNQSPCPSCGRSPARDAGECECELSPPAADERGRESDRPPDNDGDDRWKNDNQQRSLDDGR